MKLRRRILIISVGVAVSLLILLPAWNAYTATDERGIEQRISDAAITARIETALLLNEHLNPFDIDTTTKNGVVSLTGAVQSEAEEDTAVSIAESVEGVKSVTNNLKISSAPIEIDAGDPHVQWRQKMENIAQTAAVHTRLISHGELAALDIDVDSRGALVVLSGEANSEEQKEKIERVARETRGVTEVENNLVVIEEREADKNPVEKAGEKINDEWIEMKVRGSIILHRDIGIRGLDVKVENGVCTLTGEVISDQQRELAGRLAEETDGVQGVVNEIDIVDWNE